MILMLKDKTVKVRSKAGFPESRTFGFQHTKGAHKLLRVFGWAKEFTDLDKYLGWHIVEINSMPAVTDDQFEDAVAKLGVGEVYQQN